MAHLSVLLLELFFHTKLLVVYNTYNDLEHKIAKQLGNILPSNSLIL